MFGMGTGGTSPLSTPVKIGMQSGKGTVNTKERIDEVKYCNKTVAQGKKLHPKN